MNPRTLRRSLATIPLFVCALASAGNDLVRSGLGCGEIVSLRESTQNPLRTEVYEAYVPKRSTNTGGVFAQVLSALPGVGLGAAAAADIAAGQVVGSSTGSAAEQREQQEFETSKYDNVKAVEFRFDDGEVINVPMLVVSGMRYEVGARLTAWESRYDENLLSLSVRPLFWSAPKPGDSSYATTCHIDDVQHRERLIALHRYAVDEAQVVDPGQRRSAAVAVPAPASAGPVALDSLPSSATAGSVPQDVVEAPTSVAR